MAIQVSIRADEIGADFSTAYARIIRFSGNKDMVNYNVEVFASAAARRSERAPIMRKRYSIAAADIQAVTFKALYTNLKAQPEFSGGLDV